MGNGHLTSLQAAGAAAPGVRSPAPTVMASPASKAAKPTAMAPTSTPARSPVIALVISAIAILPHPISFTS
jgi:hypothetical protein